MVESLKYDLPQSSFSIVIIDDSPDLVQVYENHFKAAGIRVDAKFHKWKDSLDYFAEKKNGAGETVVLLDQKMPDIDCLELARQIKELNPRQKIVLLCVAEATPVKFDFPDERLIDGMVFKPFTMSELINSIQQATSFLRIRGGAVFNDPEEMYQVFQDALTDSKNEVCVCLSSTGVGRRIDVPDYSPIFLRARTKGLRVRLITGITKENLYACKELMVRRGVQVRHLEGISQNFSIYDGKHFLEATVLSADGSIIRQIFYSNIDTIVKKSQYLFEEFWKSAEPAEQKFRELENYPELADLSVITGTEDILNARLELINDSREHLDAYVISESLSRLLVPSVLEARRFAIARGVHCRVLTEITPDNFPLCKNLDGEGIELRHLDGVKGGFVLSEKQVIVNVLSEEYSSASEDLSAIFRSSLPNFVEQNRSIFDALWNVATPLSKRTKEFEVTGKEVKGTYN